MVSTGSLKAYSETLADYLQTTPAALYERQRALVRAFLLPAPEGRGPGGGVPVTPETVATLLIAEMGAERLADTEIRVRELMAARAIGWQKTVGLRSNTFGDALVRILGRPDIAVAISDVTVSRRSVNALIRIDGRLPDSGLSSKTIFHTAYQFSVDGKTPWPSYRLEARIGPDVIRQIARDIAGENN